MFELFSTILELALVVLLGLNIYRESELEKRIADLEKEKK